MIKSYLFPKKTFQTKEDLFKSLKKNINEIIDLKKSEIQKSCEKGISVSCKLLDLNKFTEQEKALKFDDAYYYIAVNTTRILDCHDDLHIDGLWNKSVKEQQGKNYLVADHELCLDSVIVKKAYIEMFTAKMPFSVFGKPYDGNTEALIYKFRKDKVINETAQKWLESGDEIEASVRMQYVTIEFAMDSNAPEDATEKKRYDDYIGTIANKADFEYIPYFFVIKEAKNVRESSLVVFGSNPITGALNNTPEPSMDTMDKNEPSNDTQQINKSLFNPNLI